MEPSFAVFGFRHVTAVKGATLTVRSKQPQHKQISKGDEKGKDVVLPQSNVVPVSVLKSINGRRKGDRVDDGKYHEDC